METKNVITEEDRRLAKLLTTNTPMDMRMIVEAVRARLRIANEKGVEPGQAENANVK